MKALICILSLMIANSAFALENAEALKLVRGGRVTNAYLGALSTPAGKAKLGKLILNQRIHGEGEGTTSWQDHFVLIELLYPEADDNSYHKPTAVGFKISTESESDYRPQIVRATVTIDVLAETGRYDVKEKSQEFSREDLDKLK